MHCAIMDNLILVELKFKTAFFLFFITINSLQVPASSIKKQDWCYNMITAQQKHFSNLVFL